MRALTNSSGSIIGKIAYYPFGEKLSVTGSAERFTFNGKEYDEDWGFNLYYYGARYMDPVTGQFITPDPVRDFTNQYSYVGNNPVNRIDPTGMAGIPSGIYGETNVNGFGDFSWVDEMLSSMADAENRLIEWADEKFRDKLKEKIEKDGAITIDEAVAWYIYGNGEPLSANLAFIDFSKVNPSEFPNGAGSYTDICLSPGCNDFSNLSDGLVYGSLTMTLGVDEKGYYIEKTPDGDGRQKDRFNYDQHELEGAVNERLYEMARNYGTEKVRIALEIASRSLTGLHGNSFDINLRGRYYYR